MTITKRVGTTIITSLAVALWLSPWLAAQRRGSMDQPMPMYDTNTEVTLQGTVTEVTSVEGMMGRGGKGPGLGMGGIHLMLKTDMETIEVHLGPSAFLKEQDIEIAEGDVIEVIGSRVTIGAADAVIARELRKGERSWVLRDAGGRPKWSMMGAR